MDPYIQAAAIALLAGLGAFLVFRFIAPLFPPGVIDSDEDLKRPPTAAE